MHVRFKPLINALLALTMASSGSLLVSCRPTETTPKATEANQEQRAEQQRLAERNAAAQLQRERKTASQQGWIDGHKATVACLRGERAQTDGNELRCEEQAYVQMNYAAATTP